MAAPDSLSDIHSEIQKLEHEDAQLAAHATKIAERRASIAERIAAFQRQAGQVALMSYAATTAKPTTVPVAPAVKPPSPAQPMTTAKATDSAGAGEKLLVILRKHRGAPLKVYAEKLYGDPKATGRVSSLLDYLRKTGKARTYEHGKWEAVS